MEQRFINFCLIGDLYYAKLFLKVHPDIDLYDAFCMACIYKRLNIAKWLQTLKPYLFVIKYDENGNYTGFKIRSKEEANWEKRKYALHLASQHKKNLLYLLPIDIAKAVVLFV